MNSLPDLSPFQLSTFRKNWAWFFVWGIALIILGILAISISTLSTLISILFLGFLLLGGGIVILINTFSYWWGKWGEFSLHLLMSLLYVAAGIALISNPVEGAISLTWLLGIFFVILGIFRISYSMTNKLPRNNWSLLSGIINLLLGILIMANWPASSLYIIGLFIGIDLVFSGWAYVMASLTARNI